MKAISSLLLKLLGWSVTFDDPGTQKDLEEFLFENPDLDGVIWVGIDEDGKSVHSYLMTQASYRYDSKIARLIKQVRVNG